jgi:hypothetical protein
MAVIHASKLARAAVKAQLAANFNAALAEAAAENGVDAFAIDFNDPGGSFFEAPLTLDSLAFALEQWPSEQYISAVMALFVTAAQDQKLSRPRTFSGPVQLGLRIFLRWPPADADSITKPASSAELVADAIESAFLYTFQRGEGGGAAIAWGAGLTKLAGFSEQRGELMLGDGGAWYQQIDYSFGFQVSI